MSHEATDPAQLLRYKMVSYDAHITCANNILDIRQDPELLEDAQAAIATNMCVGYEACMMEELQIEIDDINSEEMARIASDLYLRSKELIEESEQLNVDMERSWGEESGRVRPLAWFYSHYIFAKSACATVEKIHGEILLGAGQPAEIEIAKQVITDMVSYVYGSDEAIGDYAEPGVPVNALTDRERAETKACVERVFQIRHSID